MPQAKTSPTWGNKMPGPLQVWFYLVTLCSRCISVVDLTKKRSIFITIDYLSVIPSWSNSPCCYLVSVKISIISLSSQSMSSIYSIYFSIANMIYFVSFASFFAVLIYVFNFLSRVFSFLYFSIIRFIAGIVELPKVIIDIIIACLFTFHFSIFPILPALHHPRVSLAMKVFFLFIQFCHLWHHDAKLTQV